MCDVDIRMNLEDKKCHEEVGSGRRMGAEVVLRHWLIT